MSFTEQKKKYGGMSLPGGLSAFDRNYFQSRKDLDEEAAIELLVDDIRQMACKFRFKEPLAAEYEEARDHALNCLEMGEVAPRKVHHWVSDCMKCVDCLLRVYLRDILRRAVQVRGKWAKERDIYDAFEALEDEDLKMVGVRCNAVYQKRSNPLEHHFIVTVGGRPDIRRVSQRQRMEIHAFVKKFIKEALDVMVPRFREAFPAHCLD